jgi:RND family efflux transporter MFP subunit
VTLKEQNSPEIPMQEHTRFESRWLRPALGMVIAAMAWSAGASGIGAAHAQSGPSTAGAAGAAGAASAAPVAVIEMSAGDLVTPQRREMTRSIPLTGALRPRDWTTVKMRVAGEIREFLVREGQQVKKGEVMVRLDPTDFQARLDEKLADLEGGRAQLALAEKNRANQRALLDQKFISQNAYDSTQSTFQVSEARIKALEAQVRLAQKAIDDTVLRAPIAGTVSQRLAQPGEKLPVDARLIELVDLAELEVEAAVPASDIPRIRPGQQVSFRVEGFDDKAFTGRVGRINPATQPGTRSILVYVQIPNAGGLLRAGMFARGSVTVGRIEGALVIPLSAVRVEGGQTVIYSVASASLQRQPVKLGLQNDDEGVVQILDGLDAQAQIVKSNLGVLRAGSQVKLAPARK